MTKTANTTQRENRKQGLQRKRTVAKWGMVTAMGTLVLTGYLRSRQARRLHVWTGVALLGLSYWHQLLYPNNGKKLRD